VPSAVVQARSTHDVVAAIRQANAAGEAIVIWGGGTRIGVGDPPTRYDTALDLRALAGVVEHEPGDLTITVHAGTTLADLDRHLAPFGQRWPVEVGHPERATVGGTLASAPAGPSRLRYFHPRDWTIGARAVLGDGTLTRAGGRVVKNVTGYDLTKLYSGSYGTLCALVEVTLKLAARPERSVTLRAALPDPSYAYQATGALLADRLPLDALAVIIGPWAESFGASTWTALLARLAGPAAAVDRLRGALEERLPFEEVSDDEWTRVAALALGRATAVRASWARGQRLELYPGEGVLYPGVEVMHVVDDQTPEQLTALRQRVEERGGAAVIERGSASLKRAVGAWGTPRLPTAIARGLKERFDPRGVLAPGRMPA
jgi:glycolate oxidase FAD binding subunit